MYSPLTGMKRFSAHDTTRHAKKARKFEITNQAARTEDVKKTNSIDNNNNNNNSNSNNTRQVKNKRKRLRTSSITTTTTTTTTTTVQQ